MEKFKSLVGGGLMFDESTGWFELGGEMIINIIGQDMTLEEFNAYLKTLTPEELDDLVMSESI